ncbi:MAG: response regulator [Lachnospiraceae bacterium]|nr:response regulator [Lachnospiraceae bacterium]
MLQTIIDNVSEGVCIIDVATYRIEYINGAAREILGINEEDRPGYCFDYFGNGNSPCSSCNSQVLNSLKGFSKEEYYSSKDGKTYKLKTENIQQDRRKYRAVFFVELNENEEKGVVKYNDSIKIPELDAMKMPYWHYNLQTHRCIASEALLSLINPEHVSDMHPEEINDDVFASHAEADKLRELYKRILNGDDSAEAACRVIINGQKTWVNIMLAVARDESGNRTHAVGIIKNIDAQKQIVDAFDMAIAQNEFKFMSYDLESGEFNIYEAGAKRSILMAGAEMQDFGLGKFHPEDRKSVLEIIDKARRGVKEQECVLRRRHNENEVYKTYKIKITTSFDGSGTPQKIYISRKDITEEEKNRKSYESQLNYLENYRKKSLCYLRADIDKDKIVDIKTRYARFRKDVEGKSLKNYAEMISRYIPEEAQEDFKRGCSSKEIIAEYEAGKTKFEIETPFYLSDDKLIFAHFTMDVLKNPLTNDLEGYIIVHDNTEEMLIHQLGQTIIMMDYDAMGVLDIATGKVKTIYNQPDASSAFLAKEELDYTENIEFFINFIPSRSKESVRKKVALDNVIKNVKQSGKYVETITAITANGVTKHIQMSYTQINRFPNRLLMGVRDVSAIYEEEVKKRETLKKALTEAKAGENAKIDFLSRMSHDLRTPLNGILGMAQIALDEASDPAIKEYQKKIIASGQMLLSLVNDILDISQAEEKKLILHPEAYSMKEFLESINIIIGEQCKNKGVSYKVNFNPIKDKTFLLDKLRFGQIFLNLLSNSCKYTPEGGEIIFNVNTLSESDGKIKAEFHVVDTGIGMSAEFLEHAFDAFSQANTSTIDTRQGSGLGLAIVKQLVELFKGKIEVKSEKGRGTDVKIVLDLTECEEITGNADSEEKVRRDSLENRRVLVVEDQPLNAKILVKILAQKSISVDVAEDGLKAVNAYLDSKEGYYDAILMDIRMPVMDGIEATKQIRSHTERKDYNLPIIATTANAFVEDREICLEAGMNDHLPKPINSKELYRVLTEYIR